jgi:hypothetical protein
MLVLLQRCFVLALLFDECQAVCSDRFYDQYILNTTVRKTAKARLGGVQSCFNEVGAVSAC